MHMQRRDPLPAQHLQEFPLVADTSREPLKFLVVHVEAPNSGLFELRAHRAVRVIEREAHNRITAAREFQRQIYSDAFGAADLIREESLRDDRRPGFRYCSHAHMWLIARTVAGRSIARSDTRLYHACESPCCQPGGGSRVLTGLAGLPATTVSSGTSAVTTAPVATTAPRPMVTFFSMTALLPIHA